MQDQRGKVITESNMNHSQAGGHHWAAGSQASPSRLSSSSSRPPLKPRPSLRESADKRTIH